VLQQQLRQPGGPQRFQVLGIEAGAAGHGNSKGGRGMGCSDYLTGGVGGVAA